MNTPMTDPDNDPPDRDSRSIVVSWPVGEPDTEERWQARAVLAVRYDTGYGYRAVLSTRHQRPTGMRSVEQTMNLDFKRCRVTIHRREATRFSRKVLPEVYATAVRELRDRFEAADEEVTVYFDAESSVFAYAGSPVHR
ncbi:hypothetical protein OG225_43215 (plasmid) [Nocardia sp. NBC_01377]|uniref:hypothetical protein n=1 Tax=Nocardia sp. NBC_01377 TaxID=2903595 RepID=UPI002F91476C